MFTERGGVKRSERDLARRAYRGLLFQFYLPVRRKRKKDKKYSGTKKSTDEKKSSVAEIKQKVQEG